MKILIDSPVPFALAHGGAQMQIEQTKKNLEKIGVAVDWLRWWDATQKGDLIHVFGASSTGLISMARLKRVPVVTTNLFTATCNRSLARLCAHGLLTRFILGLPFGESVKDQLTWKAFRNCAHHIVGLQAEEKVLRVAFGVPAKKISVVPLGLSETFLRAGAGGRAEPHLVCVGTITGRKNSIPLARLARESQVPVLFIGDPYNRDDPYWLEFEKLIDHRWVKHHPHVPDEASLIQLYQNARGFVIMSEFENWCLAAHEAAACGLPLLVPSQNWSRERFGNEVRYFESQDFEKKAGVLRKFYEDCPSLSAPKIHLSGWEETAIGLREVYASVLSTYS